MDAPADPVLLVLLGLRLVGFGPAEAVGDVVGLPAATVRPVLADAGERGWAAFRQGRAPGWSLLPAGRAEGERRLGRELDERRARPALRAAYERFLAYNSDVLETCTAWQVRGGETLNDHHDAAYDESVIERLGTLHGAVVPVCAALAGALERFEGYEKRLSHALERVKLGDAVWFAGASVPSYHGVWFELHENLLATLGLDRSLELDRRPPRDGRPGDGQSSVEATPVLPTLAGDEPADPRYPAPR